MDPATTNMVQILKAVGQPTVTAINWNLIVTGFFGLLTSIAAGITAMYVAKVNTNSRKASENSSDTRQIAAETNLAVKAIHVAVNSERTAMIERVEKLKDEIINITSKNAALETQAKNQDISITPVLPTITFNDTQLKQIIEGLKGTRP